MQSCHEKYETNVDDASRKGKSPMTKPDNDLSPQEKLKIMMAGEEELEEDDRENGRETRRRRSDR